MSRSPPSSGLALDLRARARAVADLRLRLVQALVGAKIDLESAKSAADAWLLTALAAEELDIGGVSGALGAAGLGDFAPMNRLVRSVERATGLPIDVPESVRAAVSIRQAQLPFSAPIVLRGGDDPFGQLAQQLRGRHVVEKDGALLLDDRESRRDEGGYYTPFKLARRLAKQALESFEAVPNVIDPACGAGTFLAAAFDVLWEQLEARRREQPADRIAPVAWAVAALHGVEVDKTALLAARLSLAVRAVKADRASGGSGQLALFGQTATYGPLIVDRLRLGDSLSSAPAETVSGTERLRLRLIARDVPGRLPEAAQPDPIVWDTAFPLRFADDEGAFRPGGFDLVLTNPPFVPIDRIPPERRDVLMASLTTAQKRFDLFIGFVERAVTLLNPGGRATLLIPRTFLSEANAEKCRHLVLEQTSLAQVEELGPVAFDGAKVECIALSTIVRKPGDTHEVQIVRHGERKPVLVPQAAFRRAPRFMIRTELADPAADECLRLAAASVQLGRYFCASWGARGTPVSDFHLDAPSSPLAKPLVKGDDLQPFRIKESSRWLLYDTERLYRPSRREFFETEKVLVKKVTGAKGIVCAVDSGNHYTDDSLACVVRKASLVAIPLKDRRKHRIVIAPSQVEPSRRYDLHFVAALLQTPVVQTYYRVMLGGGLNVFPELIEALPLPKPAALDRPEAVELTRMAKAASKGGPFDLNAADKLARQLFELAVPDAPNAAESASSDV